MRRWEEPEVKWVRQASFLWDSSVTTWRQRASAGKEHKWQPLRAGMKWGNEFGKVTAHVRGSDHLQLYSGFQFIHYFFTFTVVSYVGGGKSIQERRPRNKTVIYFWLKTKIIWTAHYKGKVKTPPTPPGSVITFIQYTWHVRRISFKWKNRNKYAQRETT